MYQHYIITVYIHVHDIVTDWSYMLLPDFLIPHFLAFYFPQPILVQYNPSDLSQGTLFSHAASESVIRI